MKYLIIDLSSEEKVICRGDSKKTVIIKFLERFLNEEWAEDLIRVLEDNFDFAFHDIDNTDEI